MKSQQQKQRRRSQRSSTRKNQTADGGNGNQLAVLDAVADLRFADDFAEYVARAEGGGSTYGLLRRHAFAQSSLRIRRPTTHEDSDNSAVAAASRQRRSRSLVPPPRRRSGDQTGSADTSLPNHKSLLQALCAQTQQQQERTQHTGTLQVWTMYIAYLSIPVIVLAAMDKCNVTQGTHAVPSHPHQKSATHRTWNETLCKALSTLATIVAHFGDYSRQCGLDLMLGNPCRNSECVHITLIFIHSALFTVD